VGKALFLWVPVCITEFVGREEDRQYNTTKCCIDDPPPSQRVTHTTGMTHLKVV